MLWHSQSNPAVDLLSELSDAACFFANAPPLTSPLSHPFSPHVLSQCPHLHIAFPNVFTPCLSLAMSAFSHHHLQFRRSSHGFANALPTSLSLTTPCSMSWLYQHLPFLFVSYNVLLPVMALPMLTLPLCLLQRLAPYPGFANALPSSLSLTTSCSRLFPFVMSPLPVSLTLYSFWLSLWWILLFIKTISKTKTLLAPIGRPMFPSPTTTPIAKCN